MKTSALNPGVAIVGTQARGGIRAVIENHVQAGVYEGYQHYFIPSHDEGGIGKRIAIAFTAMVKLVILIVSGKINICHLHGSMKGSVYRKSVFVFICRLLGSKVIFHLHGSEFAKTYENAHGIYRALVRYVLNRSDSVFVLSAYWKTYTKSISDNPNIQIINNFPSPVFEDIFDTKTFPDEGPVSLVFLGHISHRKGIYDLVEAVALLKARGTRDFCITVGGNGEVEHLREQISARGLDDYFNVIGWVSGEQKFKILQESQLLLLPSHNEGLPIAILEALSAGVAVLSTRVGGIPDAIRDDRYGLLIDAGQPETLADAITQYLSTDGLIESVARNARDLYDHEYSAETNIQNIRRIFEHLAPA
ncbi:MAG: glycosyltransferase family 4 protein [Pseudomonadota bacterium]